MKKTIKVLITGSVHDGTKYLEGVNELPLDQAISLVESGHAELVPDLKLVPSDPPAGDNLTPTGDEGNTTTGPENSDSEPSQENQTPEAKVNEPEKEKADSENSDNKNPKSGKKK